MSKTRDISSLFTVIMLMVCEGTIDFCSETDPCGENQVSTLNLFGRSVNCPFYGKSGLCDSFLTERWYRTSSPMTASCPALGTCGTYYPIWLNGSEPNETDGIVTRTACMRGFRTCCDKSYQIAMRKCSTYMAYCLQHTTGCSERYCFGASEGCNTTDITTTDNTTTADNTTTTDNTTTALFTKTTTLSPTAVSPSTLAPPPTLRPQADSPAATTGAIIGIAVVVAVVLTTIVIIIIICRVRRGWKKDDDQSIMMNAVHVSAPGTINAYPNIPVENLEPDPDLSRNLYENIGRIEPHVLQNTSENLKSETDAASNGYETLGARSSADLYEEIP